MQRKTAAAVGRCALCGGRSHDQPGWVARLQDKTLSFLLDAGAAINAQANKGATALHRAVRTRRAAAVEYLLEAGADRTVKNKLGSMVLHLAV